jgi:hypothetical protein
MAMGSSEAGSTGHGFAWSDPPDDAAPAPSVVARFVEAPLATIDELQNTSATPTRADADLLLQLRSRLKRRGERG